MTRKRKVVTIRSFLLFLYQDGHIDTNLAKKVVLPFTDARTPQILTHIECNWLRMVWAGNYRDRAIIEPLLQTGIKPSELTRLTLDDLEFEEVNENVSGYIRIIGSRGKKDRFIPLNVKAYETLSDYLGARNGATNITLFLNRFDEPMGERGVQKMLRKYLKRTGIQRASVHTLRHTFGAHHLAKGTSQKKVQEIMGFKDSRSTAIYRMVAEGIVTREVRENAF